jgi:hypothetical protein
MLKFKRKVLLFKLESVYGTDSVPVAATDGLLVRNLSVSPLKLSYEARGPLVKPFYANDGQIVTGKWSEMSFEIEMAGAGGAVDAVAKYAPVLRACALAQTINAGVSVQYDPISTAEESASAYFQIDGRQHRMLGLRGNKFGMSISAGKAPVFQFGFIGLHVQPTDTALTPATLTGFTRPVSVNNANTTPFTLHGFAGKFREFSFELGLETAYRNGPNHENVVTTGRMPKGKITLESELVATKDWYTIIKGETLGALAITHGTVAGNKVKFDAPNVQITEPDEPDDGGILMLSASLDFTPGATGNDEFRITTL